MPLPTLGSRLVPSARAGTWGSDLILDFHKANPGRQKGFESRECKPPRAMLRPRAMWASGCCKPFPPSHTGSQLTWASPSECRPSLRDRDSLPRWSLVGSYMGPRPVSGLAPHYAVRVRAQGHLDHPRSPGHGESAGWFSEEPVLTALQEARSESQRGRSCMGPHVGIEWRLIPDIVKLGTGA